ncbi:TonB-dependent siderophore receptor [Phenylobacterium sp.]|uniref:TonB-dependent siderophore receptor n=1 Tax=Phenylobacterium sp. TaxID=1871053 RepID=UPI00272EFE65|nr:TonB-dependent siderophore receptor [Phenylobacterium sp.]MDP1618698.1 TonB-dependent siderophore receptor [Phenylobacterium sp.]MDP1986028.1 TonB-dependent siderophore receptor [Phenylobacterium sp.]
MLLLALLASSALVGHAQAADDEAATVRGVVVTGKKDGYAVEATDSAAKLPLSLRQTPQSVTVITTERIQDFGLSSIANVLEQTTGITVQENDSNRVNFTSRGFSISNFQLDGAPTSYSSGNSVMGDTSLYERIEVIRGAAGLVTGAGDPSATINLIRKTPTRDFAGSASVTAGSWSRGRVEADVSGPLVASGRVRGRVSAAFEDRESHIDFYEEKKTVAMAVVEADLTSSTLVRLGYDYLEATPRGSTWGTAPLFYRDGTPTDLSPNYSVAANWSTWDRNSSSLYGVIQQDLPGDWSLRLTLNQRDSESTALLYYGYGGYPDPVDGSGLFVADYYNVYQEEETGFDLFASGPFQLFGRQHEAVIGVNGFDREATTLNDRIDASRRPYAMTIPDFRNWDGRIPEPYLLKYGTPAQTTTTKETGIYGAARLNPSDRLKVILGARSTRWETQVDLFDLAGAYVRTSSDYADERVTPYVGVIYDLTSQISAYASYSDLFKPQSNKDKNNNQLAPVIGASYELGLKGEFLDGDLLASTVLFYAQQDNLAALDASVPDGFFLPDGSSAYVAVSGAETRGFEAEITGKVSERWNVVSGYTYAYTEDASGTRISTLSPRHIARLYSTYDLGGPLEGLRIGGGLNWQSGIYTLATIPVPGNTSAPGTNPPTLRTNVAQDAYVLASLTARYKFNDHLSAQLNVDNLFDKTYYRRVGFYNGGFFGEPRRVTVSLRASF